jgi:RNA recognition motif-containing protein
MTHGALEQLFAAHGNVAKVEVITDMDTGLSKGVGYVKMQTNAQARKAAAALQGQVIDGRAMVVSIAKSQLD